MKDGESYMSRHTLSRGSKKLYLQENGQDNSYDVVIETVEYGKLIISPNGDIANISFSEDEKE